MAVKIIKGDLITLGLQGKFDVIAHGCNCYGIMGAGIAKQIANQFPQTKKLDKKVSLTNLPHELLGTNSVCYLTTPIVINCYTQLTPGANFNLAAFEVCMIKLCNHIRPNSEIGIPKIGCGIGGGNWRDVHKILKKVFINRDITVVEYEDRTNKKLRSK